MNEYNFNCKNISKNVYNKNQTINFNFAIIFKNFLQCNLIN